MLRIRPPCSLLSPVIPFGSDGYKSFNCPQFFAKDFVKGSLHPRFFILSPGSANKSMFSTSTLALCDPITAGTVVGAPSCFP